MTPKASWWGVFFFFFFGGGLFGWASLAANRLSTLERCEQRMKTDIVICRREDVIIRLDDVLERLR